MVYLDTTYTNGVIAAKEKRLLKEKLFRLCEVSAEEGFRVLLDSGFGGGAETASSVYEFEKLIEREEADLDAFIQEYAPSFAERAYLLAPRDFHNAKACVKAACLERDTEGMLSPEGLVSKELILDCVKTGNFAPIKELNAYLGGACEEATAILAEEKSGAKTGEIFEKALYSYLYEVVKRKPALKKLLLAKADMTNILIAFRAGDSERAKEQYLPIGKLKIEDLDKLFLTDTEKTMRAFRETPYASFVQSCFSAKEKGLPYVEAEKMLAGYDVSYFAEHKYELKKSEPFLYYVYRRRVENANVRIVFVCLLAGLSEQDVKKRLRRW